MTALAPAVLIASFLGSLHCVAMCGPLIGLAGGGRSFKFVLLHALGRVTTYVTLGVLAGAVGGAIDLAGRVGDVQRVATVIAGIVILAWGLHAIAVAAGWIKARTGGGGMFQRGLVQLRGRKPTSRAWLIGVLTGLLPCGWLWAFVVAAAGTGSPWLGAGVMAAFWLGTVPAMTGVLTIAGPVIEALRRRMPIVTAVALMALGLGTLAMRWSNAGTDGVARPTCHSPQHGPSMGTP